jgi:hypothetical protein
MTENEKIYYRILDFLKSAKRDINITDEILRNHFYDIEQEIYNSSINDLILKNCIDKKSPNNQWRIIEFGENELARLQTAIDSDITLTIKGHLYRIVHNQTYQFIAATVGIISFVLFIWPTNKYHNTIPENKLQTDTSKKVDKPFQSEKIHNDSVGKTSK